MQENKRPKLSDIVPKSRRDPARPHEISAGISAPHKKTVDIQKPKKSPGRTQPPRDIPEEKSPRPTITNLQPQSQSNIDTPPFLIPPKKQSPFFLWGVVAGATFLVALLLTIPFAGARVEVIPKSEKIAVESVFSLSKNAENIEESTLFFETLTVKEAVFSDIPAEGEAPIEERARGTITVFNDFSTASQPLINQTRFEAPDGKIYRIQESVTVPGRVEEEGKFIPGEIEVIVVADNAGEEYNKPVGTIFTIPGFSGSARFNGFSAVLKTPLSGGFKGVQKFASEEKVLSAREDLLSRAQTRLMEQALAQVPNGYISSESLARVSAEYSTPQNAPNGKEVRVSAEVSLELVLLAQGALTNALASEALEGVSEGEVEILNLSDMSLSFAEPSEEDKKVHNQRILAVSGTPHFQWRFSSESLATSLAGKKRSAIYTTLSEFPGIEEAEVVIRPFWKRSFPDNPEKIKIRLKDTVK